MAAFTLLEMAVVVGIITLLASIVALGIDSAREMSRRTLCLGRLRQIGVALHAYHDVCRRFPGLGYAAGRAGSDELSPFPALLPHLGENGLFDLIDFYRSPYDGNYSTNVHGFNATVKSTIVSTLLCPSDGDRFAFRANTNYAFSTGSHANGRHSGAFALQRSFCAGDIPDGLSRTVGVGEIRRGGGAPAQYHAALDFWYTGYGDEQNYIGVDADQMLAICSAPRGLPSFYAYRGFSWYNGGYENTWFNHVAGPNPTETDCSMHSKGATPIARAGSYASRSAHRGGVHIGLMDGSARWMGSSIALPVWRALGTRHGGETSDAL